MIIKWQKTKDRETGGKSNRGEKRGYLQEQQ